MAGLVESKLKQCSKCKVKKDLSEFNKNYKDDHCGKCRECEKI